MPQTVIENPIINSPFEEPARHFKFSDDGITNEIVEKRRASAYFIPIASPRSKKKGGQLQFETEWTQDRVQENDLVNQIRSRISQWRADGYRGVSRVTRFLLDYWRNSEREKKLFFCQIEAAETAIYLTEAADLYGDGWIAATLREKNAQANSQLYRIAFKMATGSGKTVVMAMLISWQVLNRLASPQDGRFSDAFLVITPGITIRDRLRVLLPNDPQNFYRQRDLIPLEKLTDLGQAKIVITNFHAFLPREKGDASRLAKSILNKGSRGELAESPAQVVRRVCRELGSKRNIIVINDEAHHCYRRPATEEHLKLSAEERHEAEKRDSEARVWISGLEWVRAKVGVRVVYDLSATPFFLRGSGYPEGTLFPWVVSDFSLIDAIECGIVKIPRVPVADNQMSAGLPTYRDLWPHVREHLPRKGRKTDPHSGEPKLPKELEGALHSLYSNYEQHYHEWENGYSSGGNGQTPPVFIVVCNNTNVSKIIYDWISGWEKKLPDGSTRVVGGNLPIFSNEDSSAWRSRPNTILIDSEQLESGEAMSPEFKRIVATEIAEFKHEYRLRFPGRDAEKLTDEDIMREVLNTVGKPGKLGEQVKCVVSVSMLSEGWDANTVTHILGVRAFGTQLLCEQVVGRGLRRISYVVNSEGRFEPEYAEVYGVPFSFIPCSGGGKPPQPPPPVVRVRALEKRIGCEITFPRLEGYRYELPREELSARFGKDSMKILSTQDIPTKVELHPIVGETSIHTLEDLKRVRVQEIAFRLAKLVLEKYFLDKDGEPKRWLFPQLLGIVKRWIAECVELKDNTFPQLLMITDHAHSSAETIFRCIVRSTRGDKVLMPILYPYETIGSTRHVAFDTTKPVYATDPRYCHVSHVVADTGSWEQKTAQALEELGEEGLIRCYVKNQNLGFVIPYTHEGEEHVYVPDFLILANTGSGETLYLILEVTGQKKSDKQAKTATARSLWVPAVNNHGGFGRWAFLEITDPWNAKNEIRDTISRNLPVVTNG